MNKWLLGMAMAMLCASCTKPKESTQETVQDTYAYPGDCKVEPVVNIQAYFDSICEHHGAAVWTHGSDEQQTAEVWAAVKELDRYANHQRQYYPAEEVGKALQHMAFEQGYLYSHGAEETPRVANPGEVFLFHFIEQAAIHSPQIDFVTTFHATDGKAGILYFPEWSGINPLYSFLVYETEQGYRVLTIGEKGCTKITSIYPLTDQRGRNYYLCSNNDFIVYFDQYLYGWDGQTMTYLCEPNHLTGWDRYDDGHKIVFNPTKLTWNYCLPSNGVYQKAEDTTTLRLTLDWDKSKFEMLDDANE